MHSKEDNFAVEFLVSSGGRSGHVHTYYVRQGWFLLLPGVRRQRLVPSGPGAEPRQPKAARERDWPGQHRAVAPHHAFK